MTPSDAVQRFRDYRKSLGRTPKLHRATITARGLQFAVFRTEDPHNGTLPVICVNGGLIFDHTLLWPALSPLAARRQVILYDQRGRGQSAQPPAARASRIEFDAGDLAELPSALGLDAFHLLGHSWGGGITMLSTSFNGTPATFLTLLNPVGVSSGWLPQLTARAAARLTGAALDRLLVADAAIQPGQPAAADPAALSEFAAAIYPAWFYEPELATLLAPPRATSVAGAAVSARIRRDGYDWHSTVGPVSMPTLLMHGTADLLDLDMARDTVRTLGPLANLLPIDHAGHNPFWEAPSVVFPAIDEFLTAAERSTAP